jgi:DNA modification methylase
MIMISKVMIAKTHTAEYLLHKYWARKPHNIVANFISELVPDNGVVVDAFCGSGVVLRESQKLGRKAYGFDINPTACLISGVLVNPPDEGEFVNEVTTILDSVEEVINNSFTEDGQIIKYCVHNIITKCFKCGSINQPYGLDSKNNFCSTCNVKLRLNLENMVRTDIVSLIFEASKDIQSRHDFIDSQIQKSNQLVFDMDEDKYSFEFTKNKRILAYQGMKTRDLFTPRNFSILSHLSDKFANINDVRIRQAALLLLSASVAQCSRLIAYRNHLSTGGPAWSVPGFWVPAIHLEANPIIHLRARLRKFSRGFKDINKNINTRNISVMKIDARKGLESLTATDIYADLVFFDPPYGDSVPYVEFSSMWNSFLNDFPNPDTDISVSDRLPKSIAWDKYANDIETSVHAIQRNLKPDGKILITFNNNDMRAWQALLFALQVNNLICEFVTYQIPAVVSSKAQKSIESSYISDIYAVYRKSSVEFISHSLTVIFTVLVESAKYRGGIISKSLAQRIVLIAWIENNISADLLDQIPIIYDSIFDTVGGKMYLKNYCNSGVSSFEKDVIHLAKETLMQGPCDWHVLYEKIASGVVKYGIPDVHEIRTILKNVVVFNGNKCMALVSSSVSQQLNLFNSNQEYLDEN